MKPFRSSNLQSEAIAHGFFNRTGGVSKGIFAGLNCGPGSSDEPVAVCENRRRVAEALSPGAVLLTLYQIHSAEVVTVTAPWNTGRPRADAMVTNKPNLALGILTADCAPILFVDAEAGVIGAAHAGWKGAIGGVTDSTVAAMEKLGARRGRIHAGVGPCISQSNYEVGAEFRERFLELDSSHTRFFVESDRAGHFQFDLQDYVEERLRMASVFSIESLKACTYASENFFSFRRATHRGEKDYGRQVSAIMLKG